MLTVNGDRDAVERQLERGELACPSCGGVLGGWGNAVTRPVRQLAGIQETVLIYPSTGGRPKARRMTTELAGNQPQLYDTFNLDRWAPAVRS